MIITEKEIIFPGAKIGRWTVVSYSGNSKWLCVCECGAAKNVQSTHLKNGTSKSCGCIAREKLASRNFVHGDSKNNRLYRIWCHMIGRCYNETDARYSSYGGRGIDVCEEWKTNYSVFKEWALANGYSDSLSIDRKDNDSGYNPANCRWATPQMQSNNRRSNHLIEYNGETKTMTEWAECLGIKIGTLKDRLYRLNWPPEKALSTPARKRSVPK